MKLEELPDETIIYISGGISDVPNYLEVFKAAGDKLEALPNIFAVVSPTECEPHRRSNHPYGKYMRAVVQAMMDCDAVYMLAGWEQSVGARLEHNLAAVCGLAIVYEER